MSATAPTGFHPPSDDMLSAWLDGELPPDQRALVEAWLQAHPDDAARVRLWAADRDALVAHFEGVLEEPVPARLEQIVWHRAPATPDVSRWYRLAAAVAIFGVGLGVGGGLAWRFYATGDGQAVATNGWVHRAAVAHAVFVPELRHPVEVAVGPSGTADNRAQEAHLASWLTKRLGLPVKLFDLSAEGYELVGGRLLPDAAGPSAQLMYERRPDGSGSASGQRSASGSISGSMVPAVAGSAKARVTVYLRKPKVGQATSDAPASFSFERQGELNTFYWVEGATGYALVGAVPREQLLTLAEAIYRQGR